MLQTVTMTAGQRLEYTEVGDFFRILAGTAPVTVEFYRQGKEVAEAVGVGAGYAEKFDAGDFDKIAITSATAQTLQFVTRLGNVVQYDTPPVGQVTVTNNAGNFTQVVQTVGYASTTIKAANATRRYLLIQNNNATGAIYVNVAGAVASAGSGIFVDAGGSLEFQGYVPTGNINAMGLIESNPNIVVVEG